MLFGGLLVILFLVPSLFLYFRTLSDTERVIITVSFINHGGVRLL